MLSFYFLNILHQRLEKRSFESNEIKKYYSSYVLAEKIVRVVHISTTSNEENMPQFHFINVTRIPFKKSI